MLLADSKKATNDEEGGEQPEEEDPDRVIKNARLARPEDGLLEAEELEQLFTNGSAGSPLQSVYDHWQYFASDRTFVSRAPEAATRRGKNEPIFTSYTHYWKSTLGTNTWNNAPTRAPLTIILRPTLRLSLCPPRSRTAARSRFNPRATFHRRT